MVVTLCYMMAALNGAESWRSLVTSLEPPSHITRSSQPAAGKRCLHMRGMLWCQRGAYLKEEPSNQRRYMEA